MDRLELRKLLDKEGVKPRFYSLYGESRDWDRFVLDQSRNRWVTYYLEKDGEKIDFNVFETEDEACQYFFNWLLKYVKTKEIKSNAENM